MSEEERTPTKEPETAEEADAAMKAIEDDPPKRLEDWPGGKAKYKTFGGPETESGYGDGPTENLGPADLRHHEDGSVSVAGEAVDNPEDYKGEPIPGGPTDPEAPLDLGSEEDADEAQDRHDD
jgi:hypothetical protein